MFRVLLLYLLVKVTQQQQQIDVTVDDNHHCTQKSCQLMDGFAILVQFSLAFTALLTLFYKRSKESPKRPLTIWALDVSKQFIGAGMIHFINIGISYAASQPTTGPVTNLCVWYFLNVAVDTTLGVFILWCWFTLLQGALDKLVHEYDNLLWSWAQQLLIFLLAEILTKFCLYEIVINSPWLFWLGELCISWIKDDERLQVLFVMLIFPLVMNAVQFWLTDTILKEDPSSLKLHTTIESKKQPSSDCYQKSMITILIEQTERTPLLLPPQKHRLPL